MGEPGLAPGRSLCSPLSPHSLSRGVAAPSSPSFSLAPPGSCRAAGTDLGGGLEAWLAARSSGTRAALRNVERGWGGVGVGGAASTLRAARGRLTFPQVLVRLRVFALDWRIPGPHVSSERIFQLRGNVSHWEARLLSPGGILLLQGPVPPPCPPALGCAPANSTREADGAPGPLSKC